MEYAMKLNDFIRSLPLGKPSSILVCETDGFQLRGAVFVREGGDLAVKYAAASQQVEFSAAVHELLSLLKQQGWQGKQAILLTPGVFSTLVELPVSPREPRPALQMQEMIRWELEPMLMQHNMLSSVGQILQKLGYLDETQTAEILERQQNQHKELQTGHIGSYAFKRYCELAIDMGYITQTQRDECLAKHAWVRSDDEDFLCGWRPLLRNSPAEEDDLLGDASFTWLASGANRGMVHQWESAFASGSVILQAVYPYLGCAASLVESQQSGIVLECNDGMIGGIRLEEGVVTGIRMEPRNPDALLNSAVETYHALTPPDTQQIWLAAGAGDQDRLAQDLQALLNHDVQVLSPLGMDNSAGMLGAARDFLRMSGVGKCCGIAARGPKPPALKRVEVRAMVAGLAVLGLIATLEVSLMVRKSLADQEHARVAAVKKEFDDAVKKVQDRIDAVKKVQDEIKTKQDELTKLQARLDFFTGELPYRSVLIQTILEELTSKTGEDVLIQAVEETPSLGFRVSGWALSENAAQQFIQAFKAAMEPWGADVSDPIVRSQAGPLGLLGYAIHFRLVQAVDETGKPIGPSLLTADSGAMQ
jgi:hypothetical protein